MGFLEEMAIEDGDARELFLKAYRSQMQGDVEEAIELYEASLSQEKSAEALTFLGWAWSKKGELDRAIDLCKKAIEVDPDFGNPYNDIGAYLLQRGELKEARSWFRQALDAPRYESYCYPHHNLGRIAWLRGDLETARSHFQAALDEEPDFSDAEDGLRKVRHRLN